LVGLHMYYIRVLDKSISERKYASSSGLAASKRMTDSAKLLLRLKKKVFNNER
jgi:hypothetical protein